MAFVSLKSLATGVPDPNTALAELRTIYFRTSQKTIENDLAHAIELLKSLPEDERDKAAVFMDGIGEMYREWQRAGARKQQKKRKKKNQTPAGHAGTTAAPASDGTEAAKAKARRRK